MSLASVVGAAVPVGIIATPTMAAQQAAGGKDGPINAIGGWLGGIWDSVSNTGAKAIEGVANFEIAQWYRDMTGQDIQVGAQTSQVECIHVQIRSSPAFQDSHVLIRHLFFLPVVTQCATCSIANVRS